ncbi:MAG: hypothetical protein U9Q89_06015 [Thermodesulfobacteriota bacterium]|nr:hypothetical protein [Thermodesulfobacteriota bacterium]
MPKKRVTKKEVPKKLTADQMSRVLADTGVFSKDLACFFADIESTKKTCVQCATFIQIIDRLIRKSKQRSVQITVPGLQKNHCPYWTVSTTKRVLQRLRRLKIIRTKVEHGTSFNDKACTRIWINDYKIIALAKQMIEDQELHALAVKYAPEKINA